MSEEITGGSMPGKSQGTIGFVLSLVALVLGWLILPMLYVGMGSIGGIIGLLIPVAGIVLSAMGMSKLKKSGGSTGLAVTGLILGIIAFIILIFIYMGSAAAVGGAEMLQDNAAFQNAMQEAMDQAGN